MSRKQTPKKVDPTVLRTSAMTATPLTEDELIDRQLVEVKINEELAKDVVNPGSYGLFQQQAGSWGNPPHPVETRAVNTSSIHRDDIVASALNAQRLEIDRLTSLVENLMTTVGDLNARINRLERKKPVVKRKSTSRGGDQ